MTFEETDEILLLDADFLEKWQADVARLESEDWGELAASLGADFSKDVPAFDLSFSENYGETQ